jgi:hypothetical protein
MTTYRDCETGYEPAAKLDITEVERQKLIDSIPKLLATEEFNFCDWGKCISGIAGLGSSEKEMSGTIFWNLCCRQGKCWTTEDLLENRSGPIAATAVVRFLRGSEIDDDGNARVIHNRLKGRESVLTMGHVERAISMLRCNGGEHVERARSLLEEQEKQREDCL